MDWEKRSAFVFVKCYPGKTDKVYNTIREWNNVFGVFTTTGNWDLMVWLDTPNIEDAYKWVSKIRYWPEVEKTCTHQTYYGYRNEKHFWDKPTYAWVKIRSNDIYSTYEELKMYDWIGVLASVPGDWDCVACVCGDTYEDVYNYVWEITAKGFEVEYYPPLKEYWNKEYLRNWTWKTAKEPAPTY